MVGPSLAAFDDGLLAWGLTSSGDGALAVIDAEHGWYEVEHTGEVPFCGDAVELGPAVALIGQPSVRSDDLTGLLVDLKTRTAEPFDPPPGLGGQCRAMVATSTGLITWTTDPGARPPVTAMAFEAATGTWDPLPAPPFPAGTYETGGVWTGDRLILIGSTEDRPTFIGASYSPTDGTWTPLPDAPIATWEGPELIWTGDVVLISSSWPELLDGGEVNPFPEPLAPGGTFDPASGTWQPSMVAPVWTDGVPIWTGETAIWWLPGRQHATVYDPKDDRWWNISAPTMEEPPADHDTLWAGVWTGQQVVVTDGTDLHRWTPDLDDIVELDRSGTPRTSEPLDSNSAAGTRSGQLGLLGRACGVIGRNAITVTVTDDNHFSLEYVIDREEPCGSVIVHEGTIAGTIDPTSRRFVGDGSATVDGQAAVVHCDCEVTGENRVLGELVIDGVPKFIVAFIDG